MEYNLKSKKDYEAWQIDMQDTMQRCLAIK
jgi:hypothetical protein